MAHSSRTWTGARTPQAQKRVRQAQRRNAILQPRRSAAKTYVKNALAVTAGGDAEAAQAAVIEAVAALDKAAKVGAIHPNAAARRKSRLMLKVNAAVGGEAQVATGKVQRQVSKAAAAKAAKARIAASKASKAKGEQTAAGKARAALSRSTREATTPAADVAEGVATSTSPKAAAKAPAKGSAKEPAKTSAAKTSAVKATASKAPAKSTATKSGTTKASATKTTKAKPAKS